MLITGTHENTPEVVNPLYGESGVLRRDSWPRLPGTYHGWATLHEMQLLAHAGVKPIDVMKGATEIPAKVLHVHRDRGSIAEGKLADLVIFDGQPDRRIADVAKIWKVFYGGAEVDRL